ncbi:MAG: fructosamine kinase family protein [Anaerolineae bacterium]|jgi:fructosamine-3-kinase|nr:fructosamine kinase family protein [Anaerolineae bacterium]
MSQHLLMTEIYRPVIEEIVSAHLGRTWRILQVIDMKDRASHPALVLSDGEYSVFVKLSTAANGLEQFEVEWSCLEILSRRADILTPTMIALHTVEGAGTIMIQEGLNEIERGPQQWREIGVCLAKIHQTKGTYFGLEWQGYFGPLFQDNRPMDNWADFYAERRLYPRLMTAVDGGHLSSNDIRQIETVISRLPQLMGDAVEPTLLHGDAQRNNYVSTPEGAYVIDPAVYYGHREYDLAYLDVFQPVPEDVLDAYQEMMPIDPGFEERKDLWRLYGYLSIVSFEGIFQDKLMAAVRKYL